MGRLKKYTTENERKEFYRKYHKEYDKKYWIEVKKPKRNSLFYKAHHKKYYKGQRTKELARAKLRWKIRTKKIIRPNCMKFGCLNVAEAHHDDYNKPYDVKWLCKIHHEEYHTKVIA